MVLALLPEKFILSQYLEIKKEAKKFGKYFKTFFDYFDGYWLKHTETFCVYMQLIRTNNSEESYHRDLHDMLEHSRPTCWRLAGKYI